MINVDFSFVKKEQLVDFASYKDKVKEIDKMINERTGAGSDFLGWLKYPLTYDKEEFNRIKAKAKEFRENYDTLVVCGIGGSYLGANAAIDAINGLYPTTGMKIVYLGNTLDSTYTAQVINYLKNRNFAICCISKSGTTTETSVSFRILKSILEEKLGKERARKAIVCVTDKEKGALKTLATKEGYETYVLPDDVGGRYSVLTAVGLFPIACANIDIDDLMAGALEAMKKYDNANILENDAYKYALERFYLYSKCDYKVEMLCSYELKLRMFNEWWKQLFDESEGKDGKALLTASSVFTTDLHSLGQFIQEGSKILFETVIYIDKPALDVTIPYDEENLDGLNFIAGKNLSYVNSKAHEGTLHAHSESGNVPNIQINLNELTPFTLGELIYFFMKSCAMSAYLLGVNPFNQPGVEIYKKNMFHLLGKPGY
ncbi:MAG: glucose-6-phosphate isomerase [Firmicutes bacterium]|uniref:Glucose-6-phosphate isomerase n=1 Tax=Candidatus Onthovivens merdipullorum TaxID=2840889 RepID=A0A9D9DHU3_9BACL|nr:glucose-6-phosphate isomerase [Candidatus Onthovivens merdipullorum]